MSNITDPTVAAPHDLQAEAAVLGTLLITDSPLAVLAGDVGLRPEHFYREKHRLTYAAMLALHDRGAGVDLLTVCDELRRTGNLQIVGGENAVDALAASVASVGNVRSYAETVLREAAWRQRLTATYEMQAAIHDRNLDDFAAAETGLTQPESQARTFSRDTLGDLLVDHIKPGHEVERFPWPFRRLNVISGGGMARGQVTLIVGPTSHGKSICADMALESAGVRQNCTAHLFLNEMSVLERTARCAARLSGVPFGAIFSNRLDAEQRERVYRQAARLRFEMTQAAGWTARDVCRETRRRGYDVIAFDLVNKLPFRRDRRIDDLADASEQFNALAKDTGCHVLLVAHTNRNRATDGRRPIPTLADVKDCAQLADDADNVLFVWRNQDEQTGDPEEDGVIRFGKGRGFGTGGLEVRLAGDSMVFEEHARLEAVA